MNRLVEDILLVSGSALIGFGLGMKMFDKCLVIPEQHVNALNGMVLDLGEEVKDITKRMLGGDEDGDIFEDPFEAEKDDTIVSGLPDIERIDKEGKIFVKMPEPEIDLMDYEKYRNVTNIYHKGSLDDISQPSIIEASDYYHGYLDYAKIELTYYEDDDVLCDEKDQPIIDPEGSVGDAALVSFGVDSGDPDIVYIRNLQRECDYEIVRVHSSYQKEILGVDDDMIDEKFMYTRREVLEE